MLQTTLGTALSDTATATWNLLLEAAPYMLLGFLVAGLMRAFIPSDLVQRHLGGGRLRDVLKASLFGVPLPLCSCGVVPAAAGLRKQGAGKGAAAAFLISTPETGVDSMAVTYALLDPIMTVLRPVAAFFTATLAGVAVNALEGKEEPHSLESSLQMAPLQAAPAMDDTSTDCGCSGGSCAAPADPAASTAQPSMLRRAMQGVGFAFDDLLRDIGPWFVVGLVLAGGITALAPERFIAENLGHGIVPMLLTLVVAVPMYVCATASTPIAAALALKGLSPGAALVFLLAGPATNAASLTMVAKVIGKRATAVYLAAIVVAALGLGLAADQLYLGLGLSVADWASGASEHGHAWWHYASAVALLSLLGKVLLLRSGGHKD